MDAYRANGIACLANPQAQNAVVPTPEVSFLTNRPQAVGGINLTASHNPPDDNGVKV